MSTITTQSSKSITTIAEEIRREHEACEQDAKSAVEHAVKAGELLTDAKAQVQHGEWLPWLCQNVPFSQQTANVYMRISEKYGRSRDFPPSINAALKQISSGTYVCPKCGKSRSPSRFRPGADRCNVCVQEDHQRLDDDRQTGYVPRADDPGDVEGEWHLARIRKTEERFARAFLPAFSMFAKHLSDFREQRHYSAAMRRIDPDQVRGMRREIDQARRELLELRGDFDQLLADQEGDRR